MKRSLTLCASMLLLAPLSMALRLQDTGFSVGLGNRSVTIGDRTGTALNLLGDGKGTSVTGTTIALAHSTPTAIGEVSALVPFGEKGHAVKFIAEIQASSTSAHKLYDGQSTTGTVRALALPSIDTAEAAPTFAGSETKGRYGIYSILGGKREATVDHQAAFGGKVLYAFGEGNHNVGIGLAALWTSDNYKYTVEEPPTAASDSGVIEVGELTGTATFPNGWEQKATSGGESGEAGLTWASTDRQDKTFTPVLGTEHKYDDRMLWFGVAAEGSSAISENINFKGGLSYYKRTFDVSADFATAAPFVVVASDATMYIGHIGVSYNRSSS